LVYLFNKISLRCRNECARKSATSSTLRSNVDVFGLPGLGSSPVPMFVKRRAAGRYRALASVIPGRERLSWSL